MTELQRPPSDASRPALSPEFLHDLRTPLNQIIGYSEMLTEQAQDEGHTSFVPDLQEIHAAAIQLAALLNSGMLALPDKAPQTGKRSTPATPDTPLPDMPLPDIPLPEPQAGAAAVPSVSGIVAAAQGLILVVDDNYRNRDMLSRRLVKQGYGVAMAENGCEAMEAVRAQDFDLILLDIMMPEMDGYEVLQHLKADESLRHIPVIMISALDEMESVVRCIEMGADDYLPKPFNPTLLKARIGACLQKKQARDRELQLFEQLQQNYQQLQKLKKLRDDLTHMIVHDMRTPLTSLLAGMQTVDVMGDLNGDQREMIGISIGGGQTLLGMINDLLDVEKMESGTMQLEYSALGVETLVASAIAQVTALAESKGLELIQQVAPDLPPFQGDAGKLTRALVNLLGNAVKFTPSRGTITAAARYSQEGNSLVFSITDTGEGIPAESFAHIFEKFGQVESRKAGRMLSTGLGLAFCKLAVEAHGGHIAVESTPGQGSTFCFTIPLAVTP